MVVVAVADSQELLLPIFRVYGPEPVTFRIWGAGGVSFN